MWAARLAAVRRGNGYRAAVGMLENDFAKRILNTRGNNNMYGSVEQRWSLHRQLFDP